MYAARPPVLHPQKGRGAVPLGAPATGLARLDGVRVLVVDDDDDSLELIGAVLELAGATVRCVASVVRAMDGVSHSFDPDVVLTDFSMPDATGLDLIREFRKAASTRTIEVPILILSGHSEDNWRKRALEAGAADVVIKPFDPAYLIDRIAAALAPARSSPN